MRQPRALCAACVLIATCAALRSRQGQGSPAIFASDDASAETEDKAKVTVTLRQLEAANTRSFKAATAEKEGLAAPAPPAAPAEQAAPAESSESAELASPKRQAQNAMGGRTVELRVNRNITGIAYRKSKHMGNIDPKDFAKAGEIVRGVVEDSGKWFHCESGLYLPMMRQDGKYKLLLPLEAMPAEKEGLAAPAPPAAPAEQAAPAESSESAELASPKRQAQNATGGRTVKLRVNRGIGIAGIFYRKSKRWGDIDQKEIAWPGEIVRGIGEDRGEWFHCESGRYLPMHMQDGLIKLLLPLEALPKKEKKEAKEAKEAKERKPVKGHAIV